MHFFFKIQKIHAAQQKALNTPERRVAKRRKKEDNPFQKESKARKVCPHYGE
jgi:hypothetical protein